MNEYVVEPSSVNRSKESKNPVPLRPTGRARPSRPFLRTATMDSSALGTGRLVLAKSNAMNRMQHTRPPLPPGCAAGGCVMPPVSSCIIRGGTVHIDPLLFFLVLQWAPPSGSPADLPLVFTYKSDCTNNTEWGYHWSAPYHRFAEVVVTINPPPISLNTPPYGYSYLGPGPNYTTVFPGQNSLVGSSTAGWTETQPDGTAFSYDNTGVLRTIRNKANVRWTLTWDSGFNLVQAIQGPFGRRTSFTYTGSNLIRRIQDPGGRITTLTVNANKDLTQIVSPELCVTSLIYDGSHNLLAWVNPLGDRTSFTYASAGVISTVELPLGQVTRFNSIYSTGVHRHRPARRRHDL